MRIYSLPDITLAGFDTPTPLSITSQPCIWFQVGVISASAADPRVGDNHISASRGAPMPGGQFAPPISEIANMYDLSNEYVAGTVGDVVAVIYGI